MPLNSFERSRRAMSEGARHLAGGASSNFRLGVSPTPLVIERGEGPYVVDVDGNRLIDYYAALGPMILGHNPTAVREAVIRQLERGILYAAQTELEFEAAALVCRLVPCAERVRFVSSGTEAVQAALRLARAATGRRKIVKFEGHYHGWMDNILWSVHPTPEDSGPADAPRRAAASAGQDELAGANTDILGWNDLDAVVARLEQRDVAVVIMEPAMCNSSVIAPRAGYLEGVREACTRTGTILVFDEVITGFRLGIGGAQGRFGVTPDLCTMGKALANGFPVAAVAGRGHILDLMAGGGVLHGGTYNAHPTGMAATVATLTALAEGSAYAAIERSGRRLMEGIAGLLRDHQVVANVQGFPGIFHVAIGTSEPIENFRDSRRASKPAYVQLTTALLERGVRALERGSWFVSAAHDEAVIDRTLAIVEDAIRAAHPGRPAGMS
jgi:glutamate-1-semialdehyde 2,1-aminomutase